MQTLKFTLLGVRYFDVNTRFIVLDATTENIKTRLRGSLHQDIDVAQLKTGSVEVVGTWQQHEKHQTQFVFEALTVCPKDDLSSLQRSLFAHLEHNKAEQIAATFGVNIFNVMLNKPHDLLKMLTQAEANQILTFNGFNPIPSLPAATITQWPDWLVVLTESSVNEINNLNLAKWFYMETQHWQTTPRFKDIRPLLGHCPANDVLNAAAYSILRLHERSGHTVITANELMQQLGRAVLHPSVEQLDAEAFHIEQNLIQRQVLKDVERFVAGTITRLNFPRSHHGDPLYPEAFTPDPEQQQAINAALLHNTSIITGGPGTGKTKTVRAIIHTLGVDQKNIQLLALSGKAAQRLQEQTMLPANTMHLALGLKENAPYTSARLPSSTEVVVIDELSTVGVYLFACLCFAISLLERSPRLLLLGDDNQLESIEPGAVLSTLLKTSLPRTSLLTDHRGDAKFTAVAQTCLSGILDLDNPALNVMFGSAQELLEQFEDLCNRIPAYHGIDLINDYQILAPVYSGDIGIEKLNQLIQQRVNQQTSLPSNPNLKIGDKVILTKNTHHYKNGEIGQIIDEKNADVLIKINNRIVLAPRDQIDLAYVLSVHKFIGSEAAVICYFSAFDNDFELNKKIINTMISRAKEAIYIFAATDQHQVSLIDSNHRVTLLPSRFQELDYA